jgi:hypothetical protein
MHSLSWKSLSHHPAIVILHELNSSIVKTTYENIIEFKFAFFDENSGCNLATSILNITLNNDALSLHIAVLHEIKSLIAQSLNCLLHQLNIYLFLSRYRNARNSSPFVLYPHSLTYQIFLHCLYISIHSVYFVYCYYYWYVQLVGQFNYFNCLFLNTLHC